MSKEAEERQKPNNFPSDKPHPETTTGLWQVIAPCIAFAGVQASWAIQIGHSSAELRRLGVSDANIGLVWLAGPISGVIVQPIVGVLSDRCTSRFGRRRPFGNLGTNFYCFMENWIAFPVRFMLIGALGMFAGLVLFSNAANIANLFRGSSVRSGRRSVMAIAIAVLSFWILDIMINALQGPTRTLLGDVVSADQLALGNAFFAVANGFGKCIGYAIGAFSERIEVTYGLTASIALLLALITIFTVKEEALLCGDNTSESLNRQPANHEAEPALDQSLSAKESGKAQRIWITLKRTWAGLFTMPKPMARAFVVQCFAYFSWMIVVVYAADYVGKDVFNGNADSPSGSSARKNYDQGVQYANKGLLIMAALSIPVSGLLLPAIDLLGVKVVWCGSQIAFALALLMTKVWETPAYVTVMFAVLSLPFSASFTIPWAITALSLRAESERGMYMATFNISQSFPGIIASIAGGLIVRAGKDDLAYVMMLGGASALVAAIAVLFVISPQELQRKSWRVALHLQSAPKSLDPTKLEDL